MMIRGLEVVADFLNSAANDRQFEWHETFERPSDVVAWLRAMGLPGWQARVTQADVRWLRDSREAVRAWVAGTRDCDLSSLNAAAGSAPLVATLAAGHSELAPAGTGVRAAFGFILAQTCLADGQGELQRLKVCSNPPCHWAFVDRSKNKARVWCSMSGCGAVIKARAYRARKARSQE